MMFISTQTLLVWVDAVGWALLHFLWQGALLGLAYRVLRPLAASVTARYRLGLLSLVLMAACPLLTMAYLWPASPLASASGVLALPSATVAADAAAGAAGMLNLEALLPWLVAAWFLGACAIAVRAFAQWRRLTWLVRHATIPLADCASVLARLRTRFGIRRPVRLLGSMGIDTPMLVGWLRPVILLPISMLSGFTPQQIELIIAHELGHIRRWDYLVNLLQVVIETVLFYHPVVHWISREIRDARESCCDDLVLALADGSPVVYASALADLEQLRQDTGAAPTLTPALAASGGVLLTRIRRIVGAQVALHDPLPRTSGWPVALLIAASLVALLRTHGLSSLPPALLNVSADSVVAITHNPALLAANSSVKTETSTPAVAPAHAPDSIAQAPADLAIVPLPRPHIGVASVAVVPARISDLHPRLAEMPALPEPSAVAEPEAAEPAKTVAAPSITPSAVAAALMPVALQRVQPGYPQREKIRGVTGKVELQFSIAADGSVDDVKVVHSEPENVFDRTSIAALKQWRFAAPASPGQHFTQTFAFTRGSATGGSDTCREIIGSHICRRLAGGDESER
jgi:bla regulator protein BlaR1